MQVHDLGKYLGMPSHVGRYWVAAFSILKDRMWARINYWATKLLSKAGKEIFIKALAQAIPTFFMSCFKIPISLIDEMNAMISRFWWGKTGGGKGIHWTKWMDMCTWKLHGGMGFKDFECFNEALLGKQCWRILKNPNSLVS